MATREDSSPPPRIPFDWQGFYADFVGLTGFLSGQRGWTTRPGATQSFEIVDNETTYPPDSDAGNVSIGALTAAPLAGDVSFLLGINTTAGLPINCHAFADIGPNAGPLLRIEIIISPSDDPPARVDVSVTFPSGATIAVTDVPFAYNAVHTVEYRVVGATEYILVDGVAVFSGARHVMTGVADRNLNLWGFGDGPDVDTMMHYTSVSFTT